MDWMDENGELFSAGGNRPFYLDDPETVYYPKSGQLDVFFVSIKDGKPVGKRSRIFRAHPGCGLFGIEPGPLSSNVKLQCVGKVGTEVYRVDRRDVAGLAGDPTGRRVLTEMIDRWLTGMSDDLVAELPPRSFRTPEPGETISVEDGGIVRPLEGVRWIRLAGVTARFLGREEFPVQPEDGWFPLSEETWIEVDGEGTIESLATSEMLEDEEFWPLLEGINRAMMEGYITEARRERDRLVERAEERREVEHRKREESLDKLASILRRDEDREPVETVGRDSLVAAVKLVAAHDDIEVIEPEELRGEDQILNPLEKISNTSGFRTRQVALKADWWNRDNGALLGFLAEDETPVALIPEGRGAYEMVVPGEQRRESVDEDVNERLLDDAVQFYPPLPEKELSGWDVVQFASQGLLKEVLVVVAMGLIGGLLGLLTPILTQQIFDSIIPNAQTEQLFYVATGLIVAAIGSALFQITRSFALLRMETRMELDLQSAVWDRLLDLPVPFFRDYSVGDLARRAQGISQIRQAISGNVINTVISSTFSVFNFFLLFYYSVKLALIALGLVVVSTIFIGVVGYFRVRYQRQIQELEGELSGMIHQILEGISKLRVAGAEMRAFSRFADKFSRQREYSFRAGKATNYEQVFSGILPVLSSMVIFASVAFWLQDGPNALSTGVFLAFNSAYGQFQSAGLQMASVLLSVLEIVPLWERAQPILKNVPEVDRDRKDPGELSGSIEVQGLSFRYDEDGPLILNDLSLRIEDGEFVALVGPSGSGKSTIVRLLLGFEKPNAGSIYYDGQELSHLDLRAVRRQIGVVLQNARVQSGDIRKNIVGTSSQLTLDDAWEAAEMAGLKGDIEDMPMGMNTVVMEGGGTLSGGQKQRLLIARALVRKPRILFLDEATSALDNETQNTVSESMERLDSTRIVIAHRLSTIRNADRILVVDDGRIVEEGDYEELMELDGQFASLAQRQLV